MLDRLGSANGRVAAWLARGAAFVLALLAVVTFADVIARYFFNAPFTFTVEFTELAMGLIVYLGVGLVTHENGHIRVDVLTLRLPPRVRSVLAVITSTLALAFLAAMVWQVGGRAATLLAAGDVTPIWHVPIWPVVAVMAAGSVWFLTGVLLQLIGAGRAIAGRRPGP